MINVGMPLATSPSEILSMDLSQRTAGAAEANDYRTQVQVGEAIRAAGVKREEVFVTTKRHGSTRALQQDKI